MNSQFEIQKILINSASYPREQKWFFFFKFYKLIDFIGNYLRNKNSRSNMYFKLKNTENVGFPGVLGVIRFATANIDYKMCKLGFYSYRF